MNETPSTQGGAARNMEISLRCARSMGVTQGSRATPARGNGRNDIGGYCQAPENMSISWQNRTREIVAMGLR
ncbi:MAG: hypothetical protein H7831_09685 [Magnetococcus sp. WYHC-3]